MSALLEEKPAVAEPASAEMSVEEAAELLNVSPTYVIKLADQGILHGEGDPLRFVRNDVVAYDIAEHARQIKCMEELVALTEELGLYDLYEDATK